MSKLASMAMFVRVVEAGSFAAAAEASGVSATMVAKHVRSAEQQLGALLLHRTTRRQQLSEVGKLYYERCKRVLAEVELADASASELQASPRGQLRVVAPVSFGTHGLVPVLAQYMERHPDVSVELTLDNREIDLLEDGFDLAVHIGHVDEPGVVARPLHPYQRILAASPAYLAAHGEVAEPADLARHACLGPAYWRRFNVWRLVDAGGDVREVQVQGRFTATHGDALRVAALHGMGIALQPEAVLADDIRAGRLSRVLPGWTLKPSPIYLVYAQDRHPSAKLRTAVDFILERFA